MSGCRSVAFFGAINPSSKPATQQAYTLTGLHHLAATRPDLQPVIAHLSQMPDDATRF